MFSFNSLKCFHVVFTYFVNIAIIFSLKSLTNFKFTRFECVVMHVFHFKMFIRSLFDQTLSDKCYRVLAYSRCLYNKDNLTCEEQQRLPMDDEVLGSLDSLVVDMNDKAE